MCLESSPLVSFSQFISRRIRKVFPRIVLRNMVCLLVLLSLPIWPDGVTLPRLNASASTAVDFAGGPLGYLPLILRSLLWLTTPAQRPDDTMGRVASRTNPFTAGGAAGPSTVYTYDALGRATIVTLPDNQTLQTAYSGSAVTSTDQVLC